MLIAVYNIVHRKALIAHIDSFTNLKSIESMLLDFNPGFHNVKVHLYGGGDDSTFEIGMDILKFVESKRFLILNADIVSKGFNWSPPSLAIDARNGSIYSPVKPHSLIMFNSEISRIEYKAFKGYITRVRRREFAKPNNNRIPCSLNFRLNNFDDLEKKWADEMAQENYAARAATYSPLPQSLFFLSSSNAQQMHDEFLVEHRHESPELQRAYDKKFGLVLKNQR